MFWRKKKPDDNEKETDSQRTLRLRMEKSERDRADAAKRAADALNLLRYGPNGQQLNGD